MPHWSYQGSNRKRQVIIPTPEFAAVKDDIISKAELFSPIAYPMLIEPNDWTNERQGGYLLNEGSVEKHATTHAWSEIYLPGAGWRGFDSTSGLVVSGDHIAVAVHRHPEAIPPIAGSFLGTINAKPRLEVDVQVTRLDL